MHASMVVTGVVICMFLLSLFKFIMLTSALALLSLGDAELCKNM